MNDPAQRPSEPAAPREARLRSFDLARILVAGGVLVALIGGSLYIVSPFVPAVIWASTIVVATWPLMLRLQQAFGGRRWLAVSVMLLLEIVVICIPTFGAVYTLADRADDVMRFVQGLPNDTLPAPPRWFGSMRVLKPVTLEWQRLSEAGPGGLLARIEPYVAVAAKWLLLHIGVVGELALHLLLMIIVCGLLYAKGEAMVALLIALAVRVAPDSGAGVVYLTGQSIRAIALGVVVTALVQASLASAGIWLAGVPFAGALSALILVLCLVQLGPLLPMLGSVIWLFLHGFRITAAVLLVWAVCVSTLDNVLRPLLIQRAVALPLVLILAGVIGGLIAMGPVGLFVGPVLLAVTYHLLLDWVGATNRTAAFERAAGPARVSAEPAGVKEDAAPREE
ncbi:AI-2E family transporter [Paraburkholderia sp. MMS20-SJTR3]|uniref:AI-2E family transporter n=1 Tax=Paraburkholderia sejongensis TaxID=2886946 RepID=A0ABS8JRS0_9BURK|nr:AI-2E family transporter [Paraburkholderia sp. MMS20-SJTR3]MCC8392600.1 AI-2E family transporter [Paraburkholderia sp. MMS20-SJTR3]